MRVFILMVYVNGYWNESAFGFFDTEAACNDYGWNWLRKIERDPVWAPGNRLFRCESESALIVVIDGK